MATTMPDPEEVPTRNELIEAVGAFMEQAWVELGYTAPNTDVYPWLWLWDSCFHVLIWHALDRTDRAEQELEALLAAQDAAGFVPHMGYQLDPVVATDLWGRAGASSITQPPMYGHAIAALVRAGVPVAPELLHAATAGLRFLLERRDRDPGSGLIEVVHPWETGCDDSPRWDHYCPGDGFELAVWRRHKSDLVGAIERGPAGEPLRNPAFGAAPVSFSALTAWNARELAGVTGDDGLERMAAELAAAVAGRWDADLRTWCDAGPARSTSGRIRTADALTALLVVDDVEQRRGAFAELADPDALGGRFGPRGVHPAEPMYEPGSYWRGPVWPQLAYLLWLAAAADPGASEIAAAIADGLVAGAAASGFAEYWDGDSGAGGGAVPQSWAGLALVVANTRTISPSSSG